MRMRLCTIGALTTFALAMFVTPLLAQTSGDRNDRVQQRAMVARTLQWLRASRGLDLRPTGDAATARHDKTGSSLLGSSNGSIAGTVTMSDPSREIATVVAVSSDSAREEFFVVDAQSDGSYAIDDVPAGNYFVFAQALNCLTEFYDNVSSPDSATIVVVTGGQATTGIDFSLEAMPVGEGSITGKVLAEVGGDAILGANVWAYSLDEPFVSAWAEADPSGDYELTGLFSGRYIVQATAPGFLTEYYDDTRSFELATPVAVSTPGTTQGVDFSLSPGATISGRVVDTNGDPIAGAMIDAMPESFNGRDSAFPIPTWGSAVTDDDGYYAVVGLDSGSYIVSASVWGTWMSVQEWYDNAANPDDATPVRATLGQTVDDIDFVLEVQSFDGVIRGVVTDTSGAPIEGAYVFVMTEFDRDMPVRAGGATDADGAYMIEGLPDGNYLVAAMAQSNWDMTMRWWRNAEAPEEADTVVIRDGATTVASIDFELPLDRGTASISGTVRLIDGSAAAGAQIGLIVVDPTDSTVIFGASAMSDELGSYTIEFLPAGSYLVYASLWDGEMVGSEWYLEASDPSSATPVVLADDEERTGIDFTLEMVSYFGSVTGAVTDDATGAPISNAFIELSPADNGFEGERAYWPAYALTNEQGIYAIAQVPAGEYFASVIGNGAFEYYDDVTNPDDASTVTVSGGDTTVLNFGLTARRLGSGSIGGRVTSDDGREIEVGIVVAFPTNSNGQEAYPAVAEADGDYTISGLADGEYYVFAFSPEHIGEYYEDAWDVSEATAVSVSNGAPTIGIDFGLEAWGCFEGDDPTPGAAGGIVYGTVTDSRGVALTDANVYVVDGAKKAIASTRTKADGSYEIAGLPIGTDYRVMASSVGYSSEYNDDARRFEDADPVRVPRGRVEIDFELDASTSGIDIDDRSNGMSIAGAFPNPFTTSSSLRFSLETSAVVTVTIVNLRGETVARLHDGAFAAGTHELAWDGRSDDGTQLESGLYFARIAAGGVAKTIPVTLAN